jgi:HEAT repeat protein
MRALHVAAAASLLLGAATPAALAHGGQYRPPDGGKSPGGIPTDSEILDPKVPVPTPPTRGEMTPWERWWDMNRERVVDLKKRLRARDRRDVATGDAKEEDPFFGPDPEAPAADAGPDLSVTREFLEREVLPAATRALKDPDPEVRSAAALALGKMGFPRTFLDLRGALGDSERDVREAAVLALGMAGEPMAAESLRGILLDPGAEERLRGTAALALGFLGGAAGGEALLAYLDPASDAKRVGGIRRRPDTTCCVLAALGLARPPGAVPVLREVALSLREPDGSRNNTTVRSFALVALAKTGDRTAIPVEQVIGFLLDEDREVLRQGAALSLGLLGKPDEEAVLKALSTAALGDRDLGVRSLSTMALARIGGDGARKALRVLLDKGTAMDLPFTALALGMTGDGPSAPLLRLKFRATRDASARGALALSLGLLGDLEVAPDLRAEAFGKGDRTLRRHCMTALGLMKDVGAAPALRKLVSEEWDPSLKIAAGTALGLLQDQEALRLLGAVAKGASSVIARGHACRVLGMIGNREAAKLLLAFLANRREQGFVRMYAVTGLGILGERGDYPILSTVGFDLDPGTRVDALDAAAELM